MVVFGKNEQTEEMANQSMIGNLQTQIDMIEDRIDNLQSAVGIDYTDLKSELSDLLRYVDDVVSTQQATQAKQTEILDKLRVLREELAEALNTKSIEALTAAIGTITSSRIESRIIDGESITASVIHSTDIHSDSITADRVEATELVTDRLEMTELTADIVKSTDIQSDTIEVPQIITENIQSSKGYHSVGYNVSTEVERYRIELNDYFFMYSTDKNDQWSITWNGTMNYNNPLMTIRHILIENMEGKNYAYIDFYHPQTDLDFMLLTFGELEPIMEFETIPISEAYEDVNVGYWTSSSAEAEKGFNVVFVDKLPDFGFASYLYVTPERQSYVYSDGRFKPLTDDIYINQKQFTGLIWELQFKAAQIDVSDFSNRAFEGSLYSLKAVREIEGFDSWSKDGLLWLKNGSVFYTDSNPFLYTSIYALPETVNANKELFDSLSWEYICENEDFKYTVESLRVSNGIEEAELLGFEPMDYFNTKMNTNIDQLNYEVCRLKYMVDDMEDIDLDFVRV